MTKYKVREVRLDGDQVGIVLEGKVKLDDNTELDDGFAVWPPAEEFNNMSKKELKKLLEQHVKDRVRFLKQIHSEKVKKEEKHKEKVDKVKEELEGMEIEEVKE